MVRLMKIHEFGDPGADIVLVQLSEEHEAEFLDSEAAAIKRMSGMSFRLAAVMVDDWNRDLSPWEAARVFRKGDDFAGGAAEYLSQLTETAAEAEQTLGFVPGFRGIAGYSLAGLFAVWALYQTDRFDRAASMSGSLWFDGFTEFMEHHRPRKLPEKLYLSVGEREKLTKNARMADVESCTFRTAELFRGYGTDVRFEKNPGGHFEDPDGRIARGLRWIAEETKL